MRVGHSWMDSDLIKENPENSLEPSTKCKPREKLLPMDQEALVNYGSARNMILHLLSFRTVRNKMFVFL